MNNFILLIQSFILLFLPTIAKYIIKYIYKKSWDIFTSVSYGKYGDILKNSEIILNGPLKHKDEYNRVAVLSSINILLKNIKSARWINKSLAFKIICLAITEGKEYSLGLKEKIESFIRTAFLVFMSSVMVFVTMVIYAWIGVNIFKPSPYLEELNWIYDIILFTLHNALIISLYISLLLCLIFIIEWFTSRKKNRIPELVNNLQLCQIISYIYYLYDLELYDTDNILNRYVNSSLKKSDATSGVRNYNWGQVDILKSEFYEKYNTFIPPVAAGGYLLPYNHVKNPSRPTIVGKVRLAWFLWKEVCLGIGLVLVAIYWYCQSQNLNIIDTLMHFLQRF